MLQVLAVIIYRVMVVVVVALDLPEVMEQY